MNINDVDGVNYQRKSFCHHRLPSIFSVRVDLSRFLPNLTGYLSYSWISLSARLRASLSALASYIAWKEGCLEGEGLPISANRVTLARLGRNSLSRQGTTAFCQQSTFLACLCSPNCRSMHWSREGWLQLAWSCFVLASKYVRASTFPVSGFQSEKRPR